MIHIQASVSSDVIAQQLHGHDGEQGADPLAHLGHWKQFIKQIRVGPLGRHTDQLGIASLGLLCIAKNLLEDHTGVVFEKVLSNAQEAKARDAQLIGVAPQGPDTDLFDELLPVPQVSEWISPLLTVVPMQLLSYHIAAHRGLDVDQPRNLAKSVTVE